MKRVLNKLAIVSYLKRRRVRAGFGVHSPNRYYYIRQVLFQKSMYYAYKTLPESNVVETGLLKLAFRIANDCQATRALIVTPSEELGALLVQYLDAGKRGIQCQVVSKEEQVDKDYWASSETTFVFVDKEGLTMAPLMKQIVHWFSGAPENSTCLCAGIHLSEAHELGWESLWRGLTEGTGIYDMAAQGVIKREMRLPLRYLEI